MTYGDHEEEACEALNELLLARDALGEDRDIVLECRRHVVSATRQRLTMLAGAWHAPSGRAPTVSAVATRPLQELGAVLDSLPRTAVLDIAPSDLLPGPVAVRASTAADRWRCAARNLTIANHELSAAEAQPWVTSDAALWHLAGDCAALVEALVLLDGRLAVQGALPPASPVAATSHRLIAGDVARLARWFGTDRASDQAYASPVSSLGAFGGPRIHMGRRPEDLATAQRTLAALLRARKGDDRRRAGLRAARVVSAGQIRLADALAGWATRREDGDTLGAQFRQRIPAYQALHRSTVRLVETIPTQSSLAVAQQTEMLVQLRAFGGQAPTLAVLADINDSCREVSVSLGRALRREGMTRKTILVLCENGLGPQRPRPITNSRDPFQAACKALADEPAAAPGRVPRLAVEQREGLRTTLEREPSRVPPRARALTTTPDPTTRRPMGRTQGRSTT